MEDKISDEEYRLRALDLAKELENALFEWELGVHEDKEHREGIVGAALQIITAYLRNDQGTAEKYFKRLAERLNFEVMEKDD